MKKLKEDARISEQQYDYLKPSPNPRERLFFLPKIHQDLDKWPVPNKMPPGRPIVSDCESESYRVSEYIDSLATNHPSYIKDTHALLQKIEQIKTPQNRFFVTLGVDSLHTNINNKEGLAAVAEVFAKTKQGPDKEIMDLLKLGLENNDFIF